MAYKFSIFPISILAILAGCTSQPLPLTEWSCRNNDTEISCTENGCSVAVSGEFTPMDLTMGSEGELILCAYSGCWSGTGNEFRIAGDYLSITGLDLPWSGTDGKSADVLAMLNMKTGIATLLTNDYSHPMVCKKQ